MGQRDQGIMKTDIEWTIDKIINGQFILPVYNFAYSLFTASKAFLLAPKPFSPAVWDDLLPFVSA